MKKSCVFFMFLIIAFSGCITVQPAATTLDSFVAIMIPESSKRVLLVLNEEYRTYEEKFVPNYGKANWIPRTIKLGKSATNMAEECFRKAYGKNVEITHDKPLFLEPAKWDFVIIPKIEGFSISAQPLRQDFYQSEELICPHRATATIKISAQVINTSTNEVLNARTASGGSGAALRGAPNAYAEERLLGEAMQPAVASITMEVVKLTGK